MSFLKALDGMNSPGKTGQREESLELVGGCANSFVGGYPDPRERNSRLKSGIDTSPLNQSSGIGKALQASP